jgi:hypothetical protein
MIQKSCRFILSRSHSRGMILSSMILSSGDVTQNHGKQNHDHEPIHRKGMTLVELVVAISIVILLAGMVVAFYPGVQAQQRAADAASMFEGWVLRLLIDPNNPLTVSQCQYIDQPDDYFLQGYNVTLTGTTITFSSPASGGATPPIPPLLDFYQGQPFDPTLWNVQGSTQVPGSGDHIEVNGTGQVHLISQVGFQFQGNFAANSTTITPASMAGLAPGQTILGTGMAPSTTILSVGTSTILISKSTTDASGPGGNTLWMNTLSLQPTVNTSLQFATPTPSGSPMQVTLKNTSATPVPYLSVGCWLDIDSGPHQDSVQITGFASATATATGALDGMGGVTVALASGGNGYVTAPNVTISEGGGSGATAVATVANGQVTSITLTASGSGFISPPAVTIDPPSTTVVATVIGMKYSHSAGASVRSHGITSVGPGNTFRIIRSPRIAGDEQLILPTGIVIDLNTNNTYGNTLPITLDANGNPTSLDLLFGPSGTVVTPGVATDFLGLWVRDLNGNNEFQLGPTIIAVWARSGLIAANPPSDAGADPYLFVKGGTE